MSHLRAFWLQTPVCNGRKARAVSARPPRRGPPASQGPWRTPGAIRLGWSAGWRAAMQRPGGWPAIPWPGPAPEATASKCRWPLRPTARSWSLAGCRTATSASASIRPVRPGRPACWWWRRRRAAERDQAGIDHWVKERWPAIRQTPNDAEPVWSSSTRARWCQPVATPCACRLASHAPILASAGHRAPPPAGRAVAETP
jgi:hypothetical protein